MKCIILFLISIQLFSCNQTEREHEQTLLEYQNTLKQLEVRLANLKRQEEISDTYLVTAKLNQVVRPPDEKERQLQNQNKL